MPMPASTIAVPHRQPTSGTEGCSDPLGRGKRRRLKLPVRNYFAARSFPGLLIFRSAACPTLLPLRGSPGIARLKRPGY